MYLYFDRYGTLKEQIVFNTARVGNSGINKIFVYWESVEDFADWEQELALQARYLLQDNTQYPSATTFQFSAIPVTAELPFDNKQDLKYFRYGKEYKFLTIDIPDNILSFSGAVKAYIWVLNADKKRILGLGAFAFMVDGNIGEVKQDETITIAQWNMIAAQLGLLSGSVIDVTCDIATNTLKVYYANGTYAVRNLPPNNVQTTVSTDFMKEFFFFKNSWEQDGEQGYYLALSSSQVGFTDNKFFIQLEEKGEYNSKQGGFVLSDNIFKGNDGSVLLYSSKPFDGRLLLVGGDLLSGDILVTGLSYNSVNSQLSYKTADGITHSIYLGIEQKLNISDITQTTGDSTDKVMSQKAVTDNFARLVDGKVPESQLPSYVDDVVEYDSKSAFPATGETGKIYVDKSTNLTYRWSGSTYIQVGGGDLNLENGTGTGSLVQKTVSSSGTPYANEASGSGAVAMGKKVKSKGNTTFVIGQENEAIVGTSGSFTSGYLNVNRGSYNITGGENNANNNSWNLVIGKNNAVSDGRFGIVSGLNNEYCGGGNDENSSISMLGNNLYYVQSDSSSYGALLIGRYNRVQDTSGRLFIVGNGTSPDDRRNAFEVLKDGRAKVQSGPVEGDDVVRKQDLEKSQDDFNLKNGTGTKSVEQVINNGTTTIPISTKNPNAVSLGAPASVNVGAVGESASSFGGASNATGKRSHSEGTNTVAIGKYSHAEGDNSVALGNDSHAEGITTVAKGQASHSEGSATQSIGYSSHAEGIKTVTEGNHSHAEGNETMAHGSASHSEGTLSAANGDNSHAEGRSTSANGTNSHSEGYETTASGIASHAEGIETNANAYASHTEGEKTVVETQLPSSSSGSGSGGTSGGSTGNPDDPSWNIGEHLGEKSHAEGTGNTVYGYSAHAEGFKTTAFGHISHTEGTKTQTGENANGSINGGYSAHAEGNETKAIGYASHAEGVATRARGQGSHSEGYWSIASGEYAHTEGTTTTASGTNSHTEGRDTVASGANSHAEGFGTIAAHDNQHVEGQYNADNPDALHIVGNGTSGTDRKNAFEVLKDGTIRVPNFNSNGTQIGMATLKVINGVLTVIV